MIQSSRGSFYKNGEERTLHLSFREAMVQLRAANQLASATGLCKLESPLCKGLPRVFAITVNHRSQPSNYKCAKEMKSAK